MSQLDADQYLRLTPEITYGQSDGLYYDRTNVLLVLVMADAVVWSVDATGAMLAGALEAADLNISGQARGDILRRGAAAWERLAAATSAQILVGDGTDVVSVAVSGDLTISSAGVTTIGAGKVTATMLASGAAASSVATTDAAQTSIDFTQEREVAIFAKTTGAIKTAANAQQDFFRVGNPPQYFELAQGVGATGANTLLAANGLTPSTTGWLLTLDNTATDSLEITQGIVLGSARSFVTGTSAAFTMKCAFLVTTRANITHLGMGFRKLVAYETANVYTEWQTAYDEKAMIGIKDNAGALSTETSKATVDVSTALAHAAAANGDILALQVLVSGAGVVTYKLATATPAGSTAAQIQAAVTTAYAALATDASAVAFTFTAATVVVPSIIIAASGASAPDVKWVNYFCGLQ
jgi:hypothetical protein